mmetsp:Transcript_115244/g.223982  ORF Transcript_115244/g.223982 Transcript_115244/m.223982 type:complete len:391 (-) Transcript_115244:114-1286(-)
MPVLVPLVLVLEANLFAAVAERTFLVEDMSKSADAVMRSRAWQRKTFEFCISAHQTVSCEGNHERMEILEAAYNRKARAPSGEECKTADDGAWESCDANGKQLVKEKCEGTQQCHLMPSDHPHCSRHPFTLMRLRIQCSAGEPRPEPLQTQTFGVVTANASTTPNIAKPFLQAARLPEGATQYLPEVVKQTMPDLQESTTGPLIIEEVRPQIVVKNTITKEIDNPYLVGLSLVPCFRWTRLQKLRKREVFGNWQDWEIFARLTNCGVQEGCFHLTFPNGKVYSDDQTPPTNAALVEGELTAAPDSYWITFRGTGLKRNDYGTWGICLPKTSDMQFAVALWDAMKSGRVADKVEMGFQELWQKMRLQSFYHSFGQPLPFLRTQLHWTSQNS